MDSVRLEADSDDVIPEPEVVVHPVENPSPILVSSDYSSAVDEGARQYLYCLLYTSDAADE